ncbi:DUF4255 domain-containing protein [Paenibacillus xanthanilyticus]|uniref:DUF4255 domain-containing protein n=1 Tax=Paenibacillus xanthanilyticus TaxID=1783531 RepID=A0ABV8K7B5_9BACL
MATYAVIAEAGASLLALLREAMSPEPVTHPELIGMASPADKGDLSLSLYLYRVAESSEGRRTEFIASGSGMLQFPPLALDLYYLLTPYSSADLQSRTLDEHRILGKALQVLHDNAVLRAPYLTGSLAERGEELRITMDPMTPDALNGVWNFGSLPQKLSIPLRIGPVYIESTKLKPTTRVVERQIRVRDKGE